MAFNSRLAPTWQQLTNGIVLKTGLITPFCWSSVNAYRFHSVFIRKWSNVNGQRFHQQKPIETKTEQCERSLRTFLIIYFFLVRVVSEVYWLYPWIYGTLNMWFWNNLVHFRGFKRYLFLIIYICWEFKTWVIDRACFRFRRKYNLHYCSVVTAVYFECHFVVALV